MNIIDVTDNCKLITVPNIPAVPANKNVAHK